MKHRISRQCWFIALSLVFLPLAGCNGCYNKWKHLQSDVIGIDRTITLYNANGEPIKSWKTSSKIEDQGGTIYFLVDGKTVTISGTFIVEE